MHFQVGGGSVRPQAAAGKGATKSGDTGGNERAREKTPEDSDADDNDDEDVAFGQVGDIFLSCWWRTRV